VRGLELIEAAADDKRSFVEKRVSWALRGIGHRGFSLDFRAVKLARRLATSGDPTRRWIGNGALRDPERPALSAGVMRESASGRGRLKSTVCGCFSRFLASLELVDSRPMGLGRIDIEV
jgi:hypothetical protein